MAFVLTPRIACVDSVLKLLLGRPVTTEHSASFLDSSVGYASGEMETDETSSISPRGQRCVVASKGPSGPTWEAKHSQRLDQAV